MARLPHNTGKRPQMGDQRNEFALELGRRLRRTHRRLADIVESLGLHELTSDQVPAMAADGWAVTKKSPFPHHRRRTIRAPGS